MFKKDYPKKDQVITLPVIFRNSSIDILGAIYTEITEEDKEVDKYSYDYYICNQIREKICLSYGVRLEDELNKFICFIKNKIYLDVTGLKKGQEYDLKKIDYNKIIKFDKNKPPIVCANFDANSILIFAHRFYDLLHERSKDDDRTNISDISDWRSYCGFISIRSDIFEELQSKGITKGRKYSEIRKRRNGSAD